jgi:hypothetical protein
MMQVPVPQHLVSSVITIPFLYLCVAPILAGRTGSAARDPAPPAQTRVLANAQGLRGSLKGSVLN